MADIKLNSKFIRLAEQTHQACKLINLFLFDSANWTENNITMLFSENEFISENHVII